MTAAIRDLFSETRQKRRRGRSALWDLGRDDDDYLDLYNMLKRAEKKHIKPYALAREVFHRKVVRYREWLHAYSRVAPSAVNPEFRFYGDELVHKKRLGNKFKDLLFEAKMGLYFKNRDDPTYQDIVDNTAGLYR